MNIGLDEASGRGRFFSTPSLTKLCVPVKRNVANERDTISLRRYSDPAICFSGMSQREKSVFVMFDEH